MTYSVSHNKTGRVYAPDHPDYDKIRIDNLESAYSDLLKAVVDLQNRVSRLDDEELRWPADTYEPTSPD